MGRLSRNERIVAVAFVLMVAGWVIGPKLALDGTAVAFLGLGGLLATQVLTLDDLAGAAIYLASRAGAWTTGQTIVVDGGSTC